MPFIPDEQPDTGSSFVPDTPVVGPQPAGGSFVPDQEPSFGQQMTGRVSKGFMTVGRAFTGAPEHFVRQAGLIRQWSFAEDVLREKDPQRRTKLLKGMSESKQAFDTTAKALGEAKDWQKQGAETIIKNHPEWKSNPPESFIELLKNPRETILAITEALPLMAGAYIMSSAGQPNIAAAMMFVSEGQNMKDQVLADGGTQEEADIAYDVYGLPAAAMEKMQLDKFIKVAKGSYNALLNRTVQKVAKKGLRTATYETMKVAASEAVEEMAQGAWQEITAKMVYGKDIPGGVADFIDRRAQEGYLGYLMGLIPGVGGGVVGRIKGGGAVGVAEVPTTDVVEPGVAEAEAPVAEEVENIRIFNKSEEGEVTFHDTGDQATIDTTASIQAAQELPNGLNMTILELPDRTQLINIDVQDKGEGTGTKGLQWLIDKADQSQKPIELDAASSSKAISLYERMGFVKTGQDGNRVTMRYEPTAEVPVEPAPTEAKQPKLTRRKALALGHELPKKLGWDEAQRRDFMQETVGKRSMKGMKPAEMRTLVAAMQEQARDQGLLAPEDYPKTLFIGAEEVGTKEFIDESVATVEGLKDRAAKTPKMKPRGRAKRGRGVLGTLKAVGTGVDNINIEHLMNQIGATKEGVMKRTMDNWRRSKHQISAVFRGGVNMMNDALDKAGVTNTDLARMSSSLDPRMSLVKRAREALGKPKTKWHTVKINDKELVLSMDELMDMYLASLQDTGSGHIESGGFEVRGYKTGPIDEASMDKLRAIVEADDKAMAAMNAAIKIADDYNAPQINYTHGRLNPESMDLIADENNYWHLEPKQARKIRGKQTYNISLLENKNILKPRTGGKQPLVIRGFFPRFFSVQHAVAEYTGMAEQLRLMNMILNNDQVIENLESKGYSDVRDNLKTLLEGVQSKSSNTTSTDKLLGKILRGAYRAVLHYSPEVIASQYMSTIHYAGVVDPKYAKLLTVPPTPKLVKEMLKTNPVVWQRYYAGGQSAEMAELGQLDVSLRLLTGKHADLNKTGIAAQMTDLAAFAQGWKIAKAITKDAGLAEDTPEYWDAVNDKAEELWDTQPSWDKWGKSINTSQRGLKRVPFLFRSYFEKSLMMLHSANAKYETSEKTTADRAKQAQVYGAVLGSQMATALMRTLIGAVVWRKRKDIWDYVAAAAGAPIGMVSVVGGYLGRVLGGIIKIVAGGKPGFRGEPMSSLPGQTIEDTLAGSKDLAEAFAYYTSGDEDKAMKKLKSGTRKIILNVGTMAGVPVKQLDKIIKALETEETTEYGGGYLL